MTLSPGSAATSGHLPLSMQQEFLCLFDTGDETGPFGPRYLIVDGWRVRGRVDPEALRHALSDVVARHEALRTLLVRDAQPRGQRVLDPMPAELVVRDLPGVAVADRPRRAEELLNEIEEGTLEVKDLPLLRAVLGRFDAEDAVLVLITHHSAADAWSMQVIFRDLAHCYAARAAGRTPELTPAPQYREYTAIQLAEHDSAYLRRARGYWQEKLRGARILVAPTDRIAGPETQPRTSWFRFVQDAELRTAVTTLANTTRSSPFMVLLAAFNVMAARWTGNPDVTVPTFTPGRGHGRFQETVGSFFNFVPLRTDLTGCPTFREAVTRTRTTCLGAYAHEVPLLHVLSVAPELMSSAAVPGVAPCLFQVIQPPFVMEGERVGDLEYSAIWRRVISQPVGSDMPDGMLWSLHLGPSDDIVGALGFSAHLFDDATVHALVDRYEDLLRRLLTTPDAALDEL
jgi:hypothetical protein